MSRFTVLAASGLVASAMMAAPAFAQGVNCYNPNTDGAVNTNALPFCQEYLPASDQYQTIDRTAIFRGTPCSGANCPAPADLSNVQPFYGGTASAPVPAPAPAPAPAVVPATTVVQTAQAAAAPPAFAAVPFQAAGLSNTALAAGAIGAAALVGLVAVAASSDDDDSSTTTTTQ